MNDEHKDPPVEPVVVDVAPEGSEPGAKRPGGARDPARPDIVLASEALPERIPLLPVRGRPLFPGFPAPIHITAEQYAFLEAEIGSSSNTVGVVMVRDSKRPDGPENLHEVGTAAKILQMVPPAPDVAHVLVQGLQRFRVREALAAEQGIFVEVDYHYASRVTPDVELRAYGMAIVSTLKELVQNDPLQSEATKMFLSRSAFDDPGRLADFACNLTTASAAELQKVLAEFRVRRRIDRVLVLLKKELEISRLQGEIQKQIEEKISKQQREFFLHEQLKAIKKELGLEKEGKTAEIEKFRERLSERKLNEDAAAVVEEELKKFELLEPASPEYNVTRNYLEWLTVLPWGKTSKDVFDPKRARAVLDRDHFGLDDVKQRIVEFIAVGRMKGDIAGSILCLVGPPGVGKTSIGRSIAEAIGRRFFRFSLGGMRDEAEIKGHRRTYIGAMPGKFIQAIKTVGTQNPVIMLDEIDKIGASFQGDPASALLEVLDPEQNVSFRDHYLDVPFDLSRVLFISTANTLDTIPRPLLDRMEVIQLSGYILEEKVEIAKRHLWPKALEAHGLKAGKVRIQSAAMRSLIDGYAREAGVRNLEKQIRKILRRATVALASSPRKPIVVNQKDIQSYLGKPVFTDQGLMDGVAGTVTGLAWTSFGGETLTIEATAVLADSHGFRQTGQLGDVMKESATIAYSYVMARLAGYGADPRFFDKHFVHLHVPAGATPKDGPSAGITMATALISMVTKKPVKKKLAMTGELTLTGQVLPIGGVKEKVIAARRAGRKVLVFPEANRKDVEELPAYLKKGIGFHFAERYEDVCRVAFQADARRRPGDSRQPSLIS